MPVSHHPGPSPAIAAYQRYVASPTRLSLYRFTSDLVTPEGTYTTEHLFHDRAAALAYQAACLTNLRLSRITEVVLVPVVPTWGQPHA